VRFLKKHYYFDYAATTPVHPKVVEAMLPYFSNKFYNPSAGYELADEAYSDIEDSRKLIASLINAKTDEIYFTSGGTESDNWALRGVMVANEHKGRHLITSSIEHHAILNTCDFLKKHGFDITILPVNKHGLVEPLYLKNAIRDDTVLVSIMYANNEIGTIQPIKELAKIAHNNGCYFHTDAVQAFGHIPIDVTENGIDLLSASAHKCYGPKGVGMLYINNRVNIRPLIYGGSQEHSMRAGTYYLPGIIGFGEASRLCKDTIKQRYNRELAIRNYIINRITSEIPFCRINGDKHKRLPNNINVSFDYIEGESLLILLDSCGINVSVGSACNSSSYKKSHVLEAIKVSDNMINGTIRITIGSDTTRSDADYLVLKIKENVDKLRSYSNDYRINRRHR